MDKNPALRDPEMLDMLERSSSSSERYTPTSSIFSDPSPILAAPVKPVKGKATRNSTAYLDGLRGLAAVIVFFHHINSFDLNYHLHGFGEISENESFYFFISLPFIRVLFSGGSAAVGVFFVLSGYVLSRGPLAAKSAGQPRAALFLRLLSSVVKRPFRLYLPPLAFTLGVAVLMHLPIIGCNASIADPEPTLWAELAKWIEYSVRMFNPFQIHTGFLLYFVYDMPVWTMAIELKGSMLVYALLTVFTMLDFDFYVSLGLLAIGTIALLQTAIWTMACFVAGMLLAVIDNQTQGNHITLPLSPRGRTIMHNTLFVIGFYLLSQPLVDGKPLSSLLTPGWWYLTLLVPESYNYDVYQRYWVSWGAILVVYSVLRLSWLQSFFNTRLMQYFGRVSFMFYLVHMPVMKVLDSVVMPLIGDHYNSKGETAWWHDLLYAPLVGPVGASPRFWMNVAIQMPICLLLGDVLTRTLDTWSVRQGDRVVQKLHLSTRREVESDSKELSLPQHNVLKDRWRLGQGKGVAVGVAVSLARQVRELWN